MLPSCGSDDRRFYSFFSFFSNYVFNCSFHVQTKILSPFLKFISFCCLKILNHVVFMRIDLNQVAFNKWTGLLLVGTPIDVESRK